MDEHARGTAEDSFADKPFSKPPSHPLPDAALDQLFREARTHNAWRDVPVSETTLRALADLLKMGPTSANCCPARIVFVASPEAKKRLEPLMSAGNRAKTMAAPVTAIVGYDLRFYEKLGTLFPHEPSAPSWFDGSPEKIRENAFRNGTLQVAYLILAARSLGLDCGPMSGFDAPGVTREFFPQGDVEANVLVNLGYGDPAGVKPRLPRFSFEEFCAIA
ncbi:malonic semialdehyde reductase [Salinarimonas ramus]|uniref:Putative NADH dehydrogenase/NAD(P)H nitroreductase GCM10011322_19770 n=1 Tax=Salinarimonas ramus TaxID=690164 RepID=A0A917V3U4_9HYPH|nr:malonic semialdehyde reductase [Salinarimonas ramus]GGK33099.1 putative NADH dehydrogenase/NAD(P)H nitroreductase [Salinarimonas ramus]